MNPVNQAILIFAAPQLSLNGKRSTSDVNLDVSVPHKLDGLTLPEKHMSDKANNDSPVATAAQRLIASVKAVQNDPKQMVESATTRVAGLHFPTPAREAQAAILIDSIEHQARELVFQRDMLALQTLLRSFERDAMVLTQPLPQPIWDEHLTPWCRDGWTARDLSLDRLWPFVDGGRSTTDRIIAITNDSVTLASGTTVTRQQLGLPPIVKPVMLVSSGPPHMIGQPLPPVAEQPEIAQPRPTVEYARLTSTRTNPLSPRV
jgi:hypothetical protein